MQFGTLFFNYARPLIDTCFDERVPLKLGVSNTFIDDLRKVRLERHRRTSLAVIRLVPMSRWTR